MISTDDVPSEDGDLNVELHILQDDADGAAQVVADDDDDEALRDKCDSEDVLDRDPFERTEDDKEGEDFWSLNSTCLTRHHVVPRTRLFSLYDIVNKKPPIPLDCVDIRQEIYTNSESPEERVIHDTWWLPADQQTTVDELRKQSTDLSSPWTGKTMFNLLMNIPKPGYECCEGEETKITETTRPGNITPYNWSHLSKAHRKKRTKQWEDLQILERPLRRLRRRDVTPAEEAERYNMVLSDQIARSRRPACPAMPCVAKPSSSSLSSTTTSVCTTQADAGSSEGPKAKASLSSA